MIKKMRSIKVGVAALTALVVCLGVAPALAQDAEHAPTSEASETATGRNSIGFNVDPGGTWTPEPRATPRHKTSYGNIVLNLTDNLDGGTCIQLRNARNGVIFASSVCWAGGTYGSKTVATNVLAGTIFRVEAHKGSTVGPNNYWAGVMYY